MQRIMGLASFIVIAIAFLIPNSSGNGRSHKDYYTDAHFALHKLVRETTHSHLEDFEIVVLDKSLGMSRQKRDLKSKDSSQPITFSLSSRDHDFHVELEPNADLLADDFSVHRVHHQDGIFKNERIVIPDLNCHHIGRILSHENRKAAISTCGGLTGLLRTENDDFMIEPVPSHLPHEFPDSQQPHLLYKKHHMSRNREDVHICGKARRNPITTSLDDISEIKELSNGEIVIVQGHHTSGHQIRKESARRRPKRSEPRRSQRGNTKVIETLVVVDKALIDKHDWLIPNVTHYVLTVMNMASSLYKDPTLDEEIDIILTDLILLEDDKGLHLDHRADKSLTNFCMWQSKANITGRKKPDHAILITGTDICIDKNEPCDTLGLAQIGGMCSTTESCTINEDTGIGVAFTIAHETGHSFGLRHDGQGNSCGKRDGHVMSPTLNTKNGVFTWSACSRRAISNFFKSERSQCLDEQPSVTNIAFPDELPGQRYNASTQCKLQYGAQGDICYERYYFDWAPICKELFCFLEFDGVCKTKHMPAAEGTSCGYNKWCRRGVCVPLHSSGPDPVNGGWSRFGSWSECSRTCGRGISFKERSCSRPTPQYGGRFCEGEERIYRICNSQNCPADSPSYRAQQCSVYNSKPYRRQYFTWIPFRKYWKYNDYNKCELFCEAEGFNFFDRLDSRVIDGTPCDEDTNDVCIEGHCVHVGCDHRINSNATVDACGVCNGDNSTCIFVNGTFRNRVFDSGYYYLARIPKGARTIRIWEERCCTHTYIATRSAVNGSRYYLNGNWRVDLYGGKRFAGATWVYERKSGQGEALYTAGPLKEDIVVEVLIVRRNPGVSFTYALQDIDNTLPHDAGDPFIPPHTYAWTETFSTCSRTCGEGIRNVTAKCVQNGKHVVGGLFCNHSERPPNRTVNCNIKKCPERWKHGNWSACSRSCGDGVQTRKVVCVIEDGNGTRVVPPKECHDDRPLKHRRCLVRECPAEWKATRWTKVRTLRAATDLRVESVQNDNVN